VRRIIWLLAVVSAAVVIGCGSGPNTVVVIDTSMGPITAELYDAEAPITVKNFLAYVDAKFYDNTIFHRVIKGFMNQGGGMTVELKEKKTRDPIKNEAFNGKKNLKGTLAMARTSEPDSATAQFFINAKDNPFLDRKGGAGGEGYCVFGKVIDGMDVVEAINTVETDPRDIPVKPIFIKSIRRQ